MSHEPTAPTRRNFLSLITAGLGLAAVNTLPAKAAAIIRATAAPLTPEFSAMFASLPMDSQALVIDMSFGLFTASRRRAGLIPSDTKDPETPRNLFTDAQYVEHRHMRDSFRAADEARLAAEQAAREASEKEQRAIDAHFRKAIRAEKRATVARKRGRK